jgi:hypothetical protein
LELAGLILLALAGMLSLPYLLYCLLWLLTGRGLPVKTVDHLDHASKMRRAEKIWALQAVCTTAVAVEEPLGLRRVLCPRLCMFNGPQDAIQAVATLTQRRPLPRKRDRQRFCATADWGVQQRRDLAQRKP